MRCIYCGHDIEWGDFPNNKFFDHEKTCESRPRIEWYGITLYSEQCYKIIEEIDKKAPKSLRTYISSNWSIWHTERVLVKETSVVLEELENYPELKDYILREFKL